jgi:signal transduction histidine kinase
MRDRLVVAFVSVSLVTLAVFGVVRAYAVGDLVERGETTRVERSAQLVGAALDEHRSQVSKAYLRTLLGPGEMIRYVGPGGREVEVTAPGFESDAEAVSSKMALDEGGSVTVERSRAVVNDAISDALLAVVLLALVLGVASAFVGWLVARRLARPFQDLAGVARGVGRGRLDVELPHYAVPEADQIARALETASRQLKEMLVRNRQFLLDASHELRTPITALRLELEDLSMAIEKSQAVGEQLERSMGELDRLGAAVDAMLAATRERRVGDVDLLDLARETGARWTTNLKRVGRSVDVTGEGPVPVRLAAGAVEQLLDALIANSLANGGGTVTLDVADLDDHVRVQVRDEAPAPTTPPAALAAAQEAAAAFGGHISLDRSATSSYTLRLPRS